MSFKIDFKNYAANAFVSGFIGHYSSIPNGLFNCAGLTIVHRLSMDWILTKLPDTKSRVENNYRLKALVNFTVLCALGIPLSFAFNASSVSLIGVTAIAESIVFIAQNVLHKYQKKSSESQKTTIEKQTP